MKFQKNYLDDKRFIVGVIFTITFLLFATQYFGIPDSYDFYIYLILGISLILNILFYTRLSLRDLRNFLKEQEDEK